MFCRPEPVASRPLCVRLRCARQDRARDSPGWARNPPAGPGCVRYCCCARADSPLEAPAAPPNPALPLVALPCLPQVHEGGCLEKAGQCATKRWLQPCARSQRPVAHGSQLQRPLRRIQLAGSQAWGWPSARGNPVLCVQGQRGKQNRGPKLRLPSLACAGIPSASCRSPSTVRPIALCRSSPAPSDLCTTGPSAPLRMRARRLSGVTRACITTPALPAQT